MQEIEEIKKEISKGIECSSKFRQKIEVAVLTNVTMTYSYVDCRIYILLMKHLI